jgi:hypothetical protein
VAEVAEAITAQGEELELAAAEPVTEDPVADVKVNLTQLTTVVVVDLVDLKVGQQTTVAMVTKVLL